MYFLINLEESLMIILQQKYALAINFLMANLHQFRLLQTQIN